MEPGIRFLVIDDSVDDVALLRSTLEPLGPIEITSIESAQLAMDLLSSHESYCSFDVIVVDWRLPGVAGDQLAKAILGNPAVEGLIPVVILSSKLPPPVSDGLQESGALVLEKPIDLDGYERLAEELCTLANRSKAGVAFTN